MSDDERFFGTDDQPVAAAMAAILSHPTPAAGTIIASAILGGPEGFSFSGPQSISSERWVTLSARWGSGRHVSAYSARAQLAFAERDERPAREHGWVGEP